MLGKGCTPPSAGPFFRHNIARTLPSSVRGRRAAAVGAPGRKEATTVLRGMLPTCAYLSGRDGNGNAATQPGVQHQPAGAAGRDGAGWRLPHQARAGRRRLRHHLSRRTRSRSPASSPSRNTFPADYAARGAASRSLAALARLRRGLQVGPRPLHRGGADARPVRASQHRARATGYFRANNTGYMVLQFEEGGSFKAWLKGLEARAAPGRARRHRGAAARRAGDGAQGRLPAPRHRPRQHHHPQGRLAGADRLRLGARRDRLALQDRERARQAGLQPLRAVRHHQPASRGRGPTSTRSAPRSITRIVRQAAARCALAHGQRRVHVRPAKPRSAPTVRAS